MAISTSRVTTQILALTSGNATTTLNKEQLDALLTGTAPGPSSGGGTGSGGSSSSSGGAVSQFTSAEVATLKTYAASGFTASQIAQLKTLCGLNLNATQVTRLAKLASLDVDWESVGDLVTSDKLKQLAVSEGYAICSNSLDYIEQVTSQPNTVKERSMYILVQGASAAAASVQHEESANPSVSPTTESPSMDPGATSSPEIESGGGPESDLEIIPPVNEGPGIESATISTAPMMSAEVANTITPTKRTYKTSTTT